MKEVLSNKQIILLMTTYLFSSSVLLPFGAEAKQDAWIAIIIAAFMAAPLYILYSRVLKIYSGMNMHEIILQVFGKFFGRFFVFIYTLFSFHLGAQILIAFSVFIKNVALIDTPLFVIVIAMGALCIYVVKAGIEVKGRYCSFITPLIIFFIIALTIFSTKEFKFNNLTPVMFDGITPVLKAAFSVLAIPYSELFLVTFILAMDEKRNKPYTIFLSSLGIGTLFILIITLRNILVLGGALLQMVAYPSYIATSIISVGKVFQRLEAMVAVVYLFGGYIENAICLNAAAMGMSKLFNIKDSKKIAGPVGLLMILTSYHLYDSNIELFDFTTKIYPFYALIFLIILPVIICLAVDIKFRMSQKKRAKIN